MTDLVTDALDRVARACSLEPPNSWLSETRAAYVEIRDDFLLQTVDDIRQRKDTIEPIRRTLAITGTGASRYSLNSGVVRLTRDPLAVYETDPVRRACLPLRSEGEWTHLNQVGSAGTKRFYKLLGHPGGYQIDFYPALPSGASVSYSYITSVWLKGPSNEEKSAFTEAQDYLVIPRDIVEAGTTARFRRRRGMDYADYESEYEQKLARFSDDFGRITIVNFGQGEDSHPMRAPVPDYIPSA